MALMGDERETKNPNAAAIQKSQVEAYAFSLNKMIVSLGRFDDDGRAQDTIPILKAALATLTGESYDSEKLAAEKLVELGEDASVSPGTDNETGDPLPPFQAPELPTAPGQFSGI